MRRIAKPFAAFLALCLAPMLAQAHPLADKIPGDATGYFGWAGTQALGDSYNNSNLKGMIDAVNLKDIATQLWDKGMKDAQANGKADDAKLFGDVVDAALKYPTALYAGSFDMTDPQKPVPQLAIICQMGKDAPALAKRIGDFIDKNHKETDPPMTAKAIGDYLVFNLGKPVDLTPYLTGPIDALPMPPLSANKDFIEAAKQVSPTSAITYYSNTEASLRMVVEAAKAAPQNGPPIEQIMDALGMGAVKHIIATGGFDGKNWSTQAFVELGPDRHGLAAFLDNKTLSDDALKSIPKDASWATVGRLDGTRLLADIRTAAATIAPAAAGRINSGLLQAGNIIGIDVEKDLIANQSDEWILYGNAGAAGNSIRGITLVNAVKDEKVATQTFTALSDAINLTIAGRGGQDSKLIVTNKKGDLTFHSIELPQVTPTWTVANGKFIVTLTPAAAEAAATFDGKQSLADNPDFQALVKKLGVDKFSSFSFINSPKTAPEAYEVWTKIVTFYTAQAKEGDPKISLPPLEKITPFLAPSLELWWSDAAGMHMKSTEAFPGSQIAGGATFSIDALMIPFIEARAQGANPARRGQAPGN